MRTRPNFEGYLRDGMHWAHPSAQLSDGLALSAEDPDTTIAADLEDLRRQHYLL